jgi:metal-responsive CopG/Arc/MetJ family transcriptional regulator
MARTIISFQEDTQIIETIDKIAVKRGSDRSAIIRECIRKELQRLENKDKEEINNASE